MRRSLAPSIRKFSQISDSRISSTSTTIKETTNDENLQSVPSNKIIFNVVWAKKSTKKHKTWDGDGFLEITERTVTLKDENGKYIESTIILKSMELEEGSRIDVGSKEVELLEKLSSNTVLLKKIVVEPLVEIEEVSSSKKYKTINKFSLSKKAPSKEIDYIPLIMPEPTNLHQFKFNQSKRPISLVAVVPCLAKVLRPHQRTGVIFLYEGLLGMRTDYEHETFGVILADEMSLGKTLQCITVCYTLLKQGPYGERIARRILIVTPSSLVENWNKEINKWLATERVYTYVVDSKHKPKQFTAAAHIPFFIISYEMLVNNFDDIKSLNFDIIICDEGHRLKNNNIKAAVLLNQIDCKRRIILTGTPIQNDLQEFHSLIEFVNPGLLGTYAEYKIKYENHILKSQQPGVDNELRELGESRAKELNEIIASFVLRRTQDVNNKYLTKKQESVVFCRQSELQRHMFGVLSELYLSKRIEINPLQMITCLKKICNHPSLVSTNKDEFSQYVASLLPSSNQMTSYDSGKLAVIMAILPDVKKQGEKIVLVSNYTKTLDMFSGICDYSNYKYCRLDGSTASSDRSKIVDEFNKPESDLFIFLLSAKAGGCGLNLIGASRLVLYDNDWNPANDLQAMSRIWRDGQKRDVFIYRLLTAGTIEEKIFQRQLSKTALSGCVVDPKESSLKFSTEELKDLFSIPNGYDVCLTHEMLECCCDGSGSIPEIKTDLFEKKALKMHQLMQYEHHKSPINPEILQQMCLREAEEEIFFIFRNQSQNI